MAMEKVSHLVDIEASCEEVFTSIMNVEKRMQLSPLWGISRLIKVSPDYPQPGSRYQVQVLPDAPHGFSQGTLNASQSALVGLAQVLSLKLALSGDQNMPNKQEEPAETMESPPQPSLYSTEQTYYIDAFQPPNLLSYHLDHDCKTLVTWQCQPIRSGTRVNYQEFFCDDHGMDENFLPTVQMTIKEWLKNIKQYNELHANRWHRFLKWFLDRFYLKLRPDQRRVVSIMFVIQAMGLGTFVFAVLGWAIVNVLF